jgi:hypothetical protein
MMEVKKSGGGREAGGVRGRGKRPSVGRRRRGRNKSIKQRGVLLDENPEGIGSPPAESLYAIIRPPAAGEESGSPGAEGVATERRREELM